MIPHTIEEGLNNVQVLRQETIPNDLKGIAFSVLRRLCGTSQKLPNSCLVGKELKINGEIPFAKRIYSDLWRGDWNGKDVAVKLLRFSEDDDRAKITKVSSTLEIRSHPTSSAHVCCPFVRGFARRWYSGNNCTT